MAIGRRPYPTFPTRPHSFPSFGPSFTTSKGGVSYFCNLQHTFRELPIGFHPATLCTLCRFTTKGTGSYHTSHVGPGQDSHNARLSNYLFEQLWFFRECFFCLRERRNSFRRVPLGPFHRKAIYRGLTPHPLRRSVPRGHSISTRSRRQARCVAITSRPMSIVPNRFRYNRSRVRKAIVIVANGYSASPFHFVVSTKDFRHRHFRIDHGHLSSLHHGEERGKTSNG